MTVKDEEITALVGELEAVAHLSRVDAQRAAFVAIALAQGWTKVRIGRWLGISRARVGQKVEKLEQYAYVGKRKRAPVLVKLMARASKTDAQPTARDGVIQFQPEDWNDEEFALGLLRRAAG